MGQSHYLRNRCKFVKVTKANGQSSNQARVLVNETSFFIGTTFPSIVKKNVKISITTTIVKNVKILKSGK